MPRQPTIGIWWDSGEIIVSLSHSPTSPDKETGLCDSYYSHNDFWPDAAMRLRASPNAEYFSVPRGRVLWDSRKQLAIIVHGNATSQERLKKIAADFGLTQWISRQDIHYAMGKEADKLSG